MDNRPIGMFDSGIGGLTVLKEYMKLLPNENYIYYADTEHLPYGNKSKEEIISYADNIAEYLISKNVKAIIIACGTASSLAYEHLKEKYDVPIFDIITPVAQRIHATNIGILATQGSVKSGVWESKLHAENPKSNIHSHACPMLVPLAEKGLSHSFIAKYYIKKYLKDFKQRSLEACILGCTHYPLFNNFIQKELGKNVELINIGTPSAKMFQEYLTAHSLETSSQAQGNVTYIASGNEKEFMKKVHILIEN